MHRPQVPGVLLRQPITFGNHPVVITYHPVVLFQPFFVIHGDYDQSTRVRVARRPALE
jgi:hypothetical protein